MFAFVLADFSKNTLLLARDIAGEKPLYYYEDRDEVVVASEIKAILARTGAVELNITEEFQAFEYTTGEETLFQNIFALLPGHQMTIAGIDGDYRGALKKQYWNLDSELYEVAPERAVDLLDELLCDAVRIRLRSDVPVGLYLSGGIDSSLLACLARPSEVFSIHFAEGPKYDELRYAELIAKQINARHTIVRPTREDLHSSLSEVLYYLDQPVGSFSAFPLYMLAREASKSVKVILSGEGADELFSGYTRYLLPVFEEQAYQIPALQNYRSLVDYYLGSSLDRFSHLLNRGRVSDEVVKSVIAPHFARFPDLIHAMGYTEFKLMLVTLLHMEDRMASAFGVENRTPFLDKRIIAFAFSIPSTLKIAKMTPKFIVREVAKRYLPHEILERKEKLGLIAPINRWMNFSGVRGEFDRSSYNAMCLEQWREIFFVEKRFLRSVSRDER
jgi:asparagine synthase (glutamine-hydrolysing)